MQPKRTPPWFELLIHVLLLGIMFGFPLLLDTDQTPDWTRHYRMWFFQMFSVVVFYANYFFLVEHYLFNRKVWQYLAANLVLFILCACSIEFLQPLLFPFREMADRFMPGGRPQGAPRFPVPPGSPHALPLSGGPHHGFFRYPHAIPFVFMAVLSVAIKMTMRWYQSEALRKEQEKSRLESELSHLRLQLNPHFFFNTLNNIYALVGQDQARAQEAIHQLSHLMRYLLHENEQPQVPLSREINFLTNYITLMRLRLPKTIRVEVDMAPPAAEVVIAPLLFVSLIENAFKHGVRTAADAFITIRLRAIADQVSLEVENSLFPAQTDDRQGSGIGLENLRKRLALLYPGQHELVIEKRDHSFYVNLTIRPCHSPA